MQLKVSTLFIALACSLAAFTFSSCKKDKDKEEETPENKIVGVWTFDKTELNIFIMGDLTQQVDNYDDESEKVEFKSDGTLVYTSPDGTSNGTWQVSNNRLTTTGLNDDLEGVFPSYEIRTLTNTQLVLYQKNTQGDNYAEITAYLKR